MFDDSDRNRDTPANARWWRRLVGEMLIRSLFFLGFALIVGAIVVGSVAMHFGISIPAAITGIFVLFAVLVFAHAVMTNGL